MRIVLLGAVCLVLAGCQSGPSEVVQKVKYDFGIGERPEGYEAPSDRVVERLRVVGETELKRLNREGRHGEILFQDQGSMTGKYYKQVKMYDKSFPLEVNAVSHGAAGERGYVGFVEFSYEIMQGERKNTRAEAAAESPAIRTGETGREVYRYKFNSSGAWDGGEGQLTRR